MGHSIPVTLYIVSDNRISAMEELENGTANVFFDYQNACFGATYDDQRVFTLEALVEPSTISSPTVPLDNYLENW